jgi:hypothetical protein
MDRPSLRRGIALFVALAVVMLPSFGCRGLTTTVAYFLWGTDVDADFADLKGKKVAVVCRPPATLQYRDSNVGRDLAQQVTLLLEKNVPKIQTISAQKVAKWIDENTYEEFPEVGKALKADMVVAIELESFGTMQGQTLRQGHANAVVKVFDCRNGGKEVFNKPMAPSVYPPSGGIATSEREEPVFRREFIAVLADQIARHFYAHDRYADLGQDAAALK